MITFSSLQIRRGNQLLLDNATATINPKQKVGLVGKNGCGKTTLLTLLKGELQPDSGNYMFPKNWALAWVDQETPALEMSVLDYVINGDREFRKLEQELIIANKKNDGNKIAELHNKLDIIDAWSIQTRAAVLLNGLGFLPEQLSMPVSAFSGGWRMRLNLVQALICRSDLLLLDEPTNHLDLDAVIWLEKWLKNYSGTLILISHDRDFLDAIVNKIIHIEHQKLNEYSGNYQLFEQQRAMKLAQQNSLYQQQQKKVAHLQHYIDRFRAKATKAKQAQSRVKMLERMEQIAPAHVDNPFHFSFKPLGMLPNPLITMTNISVGYGDTTVLDSIKLNLVPGSRIGLLGRNGAGKSTLIKLLAGLLPPKRGELTLAKGITLGYFAQHQLETLRMDESPLWHLKQLADSSVTEQAQRNYLGGFGFQGDKVNESVITFSGGEKARLVLALIVWQAPNLLLLDEPTNHLDLDMRQALTEALIDYEGVVIVVSHDRHLLRATTDEFYLVHEGKVSYFNGDLDDYQIWLSESQKQLIALQAEDSNQVITETVPVSSRKEQKRREAEFRQKLQPIRKQLLQCEQQIDKLSNALQTIEMSLADPVFYAIEQKTELTQLLVQQKDTRRALNEVESQWLTLQTEIEQHTAQFDSES